MIEEIKSIRVRLHGAICSMQGGRPENQDDVGFVDTPLGFLLIVCDGMGGGPGGKTASGIVKRVFIEVLRGCGMQFSREEAVKLATSRAQEALVNAMRIQPELSGMGSTFVAILINEHSALIAHAGDSRAYRLHGSRMLFRSEDHSLVEELIKKKALTREEARLSPQSNIITRGLGSIGNNIAQLDKVAYKVGDRFVLCTDGVWGILPHGELLRRLTKPMNETALVSSLSAEIDDVGNANGGGHDNHTLAIICMDCNSKKSDLSSLLKPQYLYVAAATLAVIAVVAVIIILSLSKKDDTPYNKSPLPYSITEHAVESQLKGLIERPFKDKKIETTKEGDDPTCPAKIDTIKWDTAKGSGDSKGSQTDESYDTRKENVNAAISPDSIINEMEVCLDSMLHMQRGTTKEAIEEQWDLYKKVDVRIDSLDSLTQRAAHNEISDFKDVLEIKTNPRNHNSPPLVAEIDKTATPTERAKEQIKAAKSALDNVKRKLDNKQ